MSSKAAAKAAQAANRVIPVHKKYTLQSTGIWEVIRRFFAVDPSRSNGVPLNPQFRNPPPGSVDPLRFEDPVTLPAGDIADNAYWKRDFRRSYPKLSVVNQGDVVGLLEMGNSVEAKRELIGDAGSKALLEVKDKGQQGGLAKYFEAEGASKAKEVLNSNGLPPTPNGVGFWKGARSYELTEENAYPSHYPCRTFQ